MSWKISQIWQAIICDDMLPLVDRQMIARWMTLNDLDRLFHDKMRFWPALLESERLNVRNSRPQPLRFCGVLCIARSVSQPIGRHGQLMRCFSAVAELLVYFSEDCKLIVYIFNVSTVLIFTTGYMSGQKLTCPKIILWHFVSEFRERETYVMGRVGWVLLSVQCTALAAALHRL